MTDIKLNTPYENGVDITWQELEERFPDKRVWFTNMRCPDGESLNFNDATVTLYGVFDINSDEDVAMINRLANRGILVGGAYTGGDPEVTTLPCIAVL